jgi:hypothetical protein
MANKPLSSSTGLDQTVSPYAKTDIQRAIENNICSICRANKKPPPCPGHGIGASGGEAGSEASESTGATLAGTSDDASALTHTTNAATKPIVNDKTPKLDRKTFTPESIVEMLEKKLLSIDNNSEQGILSIKWNNALLSPAQKIELRKFIDTLQKELEEFKDKNNISVNCTTIENDHKGDMTAIRFRLPHPSLYDAFIQQLTSKNLLPQQNVSQQQRMTYSPPSNHTGTPLATKLTLQASAKSKNLPEENDAQATRNKLPCPLSMDGPKPK